MPYGRGYADTSGGIGLLRRLATGGCFTDALYENKMVIQNAAAVNNKYGFRMCGE